MSQSWGFCRVCGAPYSIRKNGMMRRHERLILAYAYGSRDRHELCPGSGRPPKGSDE